jgi:hypothetical protein
VVIVAVEYIAPDTSKELVGSPDIGHIEVPACAGQDDDFTARLPERLRECEILRPLRPDQKGRPSLFTTAPYNLNESLPF